MQFSLKHLILLMIIVAINVSIFIEVRATQENRTQTALVRAKQYQLLSSRNLFKMQNENLILRNRRIEEKIAIYKSVRKSMNRIFADAVLAESEVVPRANMLSVREVPLLDDGSAFHKRFRVFVPEENAFQLRLFFSGQRDATDVPCSEDFEIVEQTSIVLGSGLHEIDVRMSKGSEEDNASTPPVFSVSVDGQVEIKSSFMHTKTTGGSSRNYDFAKQKDYEVGQTKKYPQLVYFRPSPGKTTANLKLEEAGSAGATNE